VRSDNQAEALALSPKRGAREGCVVSGRRVADGPPLSMKVNRSVAWSAGAQAVIALTDLASQTASACPS